MDKNYFISKANWPDQQDILFSLRENVFVIEQGVAPDIEWDGRDHLCQHVIATSSDEQPIGTGRILPNGHIGRIAVIVQWRGRGVGNAILDLLIKIARNNNIEQVFLNSQTHAMDFYSKFGFSPTGKVFMEAGIPHQKMILGFAQKSCTT